MGLTRGFMVFQHLCADKQVWWLLGCRCWHETRRLHCLRQTPLNHWSADESILSKAPQRTPTEGCSIKSEKQIESNKYQIWRNPRRRCSSLACIRALCFFVGGCWSLWRFCHPTELTKHQYLHECRLVVISVAACPDTKKTCEFGGSAALGLEKVDANCI